MLSESEQDVATNQKNDIFCKMMNTEIVAWKKVKSNAAIVGKEYLNILDFGVKAIFL